MNPYAPQDRPFQHRPAQQVPVRPAARQFPEQQHRPAQQFPAQQRPTQQFPVQQRSWPPAPGRQTPFQQAPFRAAPVPQLPVLPAALPYQPAQLPAARRSPHPALIVAFGVLVAALVVTTVMLVQGSKGQQPVQSATTQPTPPVVLTTTSGVPTTGPTTTEPTTTEPTTTEPTTTEPTTTEPTTTEPTTTEPTTTKPTTTRPTGGDSEAAVIRGASAAAAAWAQAVNDGDTDGVLAHSCRQDLRVYDSGDLTNPGRLGGKYTFKIQKLVALTGTGTAAVVRFGISPKLGSLSTLDSYVTLQSGRWLVCISVTKRADL